MSTYLYHSDAELLPFIAQGDQAAFEVLFTRYRSRIFYYVLRHTKSSETAEEIVTDIFMKLWIGKPLIGQVDNVAAFLYKVAYYKSMDFLRTVARHSKLQQHYIHRALTDSDPDKTADEVMIDQETRQLLQQAIQSLPAQRKLIYQLSRQQGLSHEEIASALGLSRNTVSNAISAATKSVVQYLEPYLKGKAALSVFFLV